MSLKVEIMFLLVTYSKWKIYGRRSSLDIEKIFKKDEEQSLLCCSIRALLITISTMALIVLYWNNDYLECCR